ncbi:MAG: myo-inosose-2 dehydratase [Gammaproteobacteria bacterium]|nr:myo-inosose-2 dehydratase [Gammaproteobacteria bacterium]
MFKPNTIKLGIAPINWTNDDLPELGGEIPFETCIAEMAQAGFTGSEIGNKYPRDPKILQKKLKHVGLEISSAWCSTYFTEANREEETIRSYTSFMKFLKAMGAKYVNLAECGHCTQGGNLPILTNKPILNEKLWHALTTGLEKLGEIAKQNGMTNVYHYHMGTSVQTQDEIARLMQNTNPELLSLLLDTGHLYFAGGDSLQLIKDFGNRIKYVHLKDIRKNVLADTRRLGLCFLDAVKAGVFTVPGDGNIDYQPIFSALSGLNYSGWFIVEAEQDPAKANPLQFAKKARDYIKEKTGV